MVDGVVDSAATEQRSPAPARRRFRRWRTLWVIAPVLFLVMLGVARIIYWRISIDYAPLKAEGSARPAVGPPGNVRSNPSGLVLTGAAGTQQLIEFAIENHGNHPIDLN